MVTISFHREQGEKYKIHRIPQGSIKKERSIDPYQGLKTSLATCSSSLAAVVASAARALPSIGFWSLAFYLSCSNHQAITSDVFTYIFFPLFFRLAVFFHFFPFACSFSPLLERFCSLFPFSFSLLNVWTLFFIKIRWTFSNSWTNFSKSMNTFFKTDDFFPKSTHSFQNRWTLFQINELFFKSMNSLWNLFQNRWTFSKSMNSFSNRWTFSKSPNSFQNLFQTDDLFSK